MKALVCLLTSCFAVPLCAAEPAVRFDDSAADRMRVVAGTYELQLSKANGAILAIDDRVAEVSLTLGSRNGCLWGTTYVSASAYRGGCNYAAGRADSFSYEWQESAGTLRLDYKPASEAAQRVTAAVIIEFQPSSFAMKLSIENAMGLTLQTVLFPSDLVF